VIYVWPRVPGTRVSGWLSMRLTAAPVVGPVMLTLQFAEHKRTTVRVRPGQPETIRIPVCAATDAHVTYFSKKLALVGLRAVTVKATRPVFTPSRAACSSLSDGLRADVAVPQSDLVA
jgi:hypothetical protein